MRVPQNMYSATIDASTAIDTELAETAGNAVDMTLSLLIRGWGFSALVSCVLTHDSLNRAVLHS